MSPESAAFSKRSDRLARKLAWEGSVCCCAASFNLTAASVKTYVNSGGFSVCRFWRSRKTSVAFERSSLSDEETALDWIVVPLPAGLEVEKAENSPNSDVLIELRVLLIEDIKNHIGRAWITLYGCRNDPTAPAW